MHLERCSARASSTGMAGWLAAWGREEQSEDYEGTYKRGKLSTLKLRKDERE